MIKKPFSVLVFLSFLCVLFLTKPQEIYASYCDTSPTVSISKSNCGPSYDCNNNIGIYDFDATDTCTSLGACAEVYTVPLQTICYAKKQSSSTQAQSSSTSQSCGTLNNVCCSAPDFCNDGLEATSLGVASGACYCQNPSSPLSDSKTVSTTKSSTAFPEITLPCNKARNAEFDSLRPYQAAPCGEANKAYYCSNDLIFVESFELKDRCTPKKQTGDFTCYPNYKVDPHNLYVSLDGSNLPILGNTEDVKNSQSSDETLDDAEKVNEYVSWYLSGVNTRAEYGEPSTEQVVNYSGPLQKLLPEAIADAERTKVIEGSINEDMQNHNQIVVCGQSNVPIIGNLFNLGTFTPVECYPNTGDTVTTKGRVFRLKTSTLGSGALARDVLSGGADGWDGTLSLFNSAANIIPTFVDRFAEILPEVPKNIIKKYISAAWNKKTPPLPWDDGSGKPFASEILYRKAYNEWRGKSCVVVPIVDTLVCLDNIFVPNKYADLFQYVPLARTTDKEGSENIDNVTISGQSGTVVDANPGSWPKVVPSLYFAHTEEVKQLSELLNKTYTPKGVTGESLPETTEKNTCSVVNIRTNKGDNLFPGDTDELQIKGVNYVITEVTCHETYEEKCEWDEKTKKEKCVWVDEYDCPADIGITIKTSTVTPYANNIFSTTVADSASTFRKIYPKVEEGAPVSCIADIPTVTNVTYDSTGSEGPNGGAQSFSVKNNPADGVNTNPQLTFPHLGSVYEYFLNGIQTALRPKGYGDPTPISGNCETANDSSLDDICAVADDYNIPCCQLQGIAATETNSGANMGSGTCGNFSCCHGSVCGPSQIACGQYSVLAGSDNLDMCSDVGSAELLARSMLLKLCQADGVCNSYDWNTWGSYVKEHYNIEDGDYTAAAYHYGIQNGCAVTACSQYRWGAGKSYCDSVKSYCETGQILQPVTSSQFCNACNEEIVRAGQAPINCP